MFKHELKLIVLAASLLALSPVSRLHAGSDLTCYARLEKDVLSIGNDRIEWVFQWNKGDLQTISLTDKSRDDRLTMQGKRSDISLGKAAGKIVSGRWTKKVVEDAIANPHLQVEVTASYEQLDVRRVFRVYPDTAVVGCDYYLRARKEEALDFSARDTVLQLLPLAGSHWHYRAVEFIDRTDANNNLVRETQVLAFNSPSQLRGNILYGEYSLSDTAFFMIKEAPCSSMQLYYPGFDFRVSHKSAAAVGMGVAKDDLTAGNWIRVYGLATGLCRKSEISFLKNLRSYQKQLRKSIPQRDDMIMMNTWGDRNRDAKLGEEFAKKEIDACARLGVTHLQLDDGWQAGLSANSSVKGGRLWDLWDAESWKPHPERFPNGLRPVVEYARNKGVRLGLWFHPSNANDYEHWLRDAKILVGMYKEHGISNIKIDGVKLPTKKADINFRCFAEYVSRNTDGQVVLNLDTTAWNDPRTGYHYCTEYGNLFLENRYSDWTNYYPHWTLRNLWLLSKYVPAEKFQIEFLNTWRNAHKYKRNDPLAPCNVPFEYAFAVTMMGQPLAWFEGTGLPEEAFEIAPTVKAYRRHQSDIHGGKIMPIGAEPKGVNWTGFQSILDGKAGYALVFREYNEDDTARIELHDLEGKRLRFTHICGQGQDFATKADSDGGVTFSLPGPHNFGLYRYEASQ